MTARIIHRLIALVPVGMLLWSCNIPKQVAKTENTSTPASYNDSQDTATIADTKWQSYFSDPQLSALIDTALKNNQELNITLQEIEISKNEIRARKGEYLPFVGLNAGADYDKEGRYTTNEAIKENIDPVTNKEALESNSNFIIGAFASWEVDVWKKLRNAQKSAVMQYLATREGKNFMVTNLVSEIANSYYELMALDNMLDIVEKNIAIQGDALHVVKLQKESAKATQLAVNRFEAQLLHTQNLQYEIRQKMVETENRINFLVGRFPQPVLRDWQRFSDLETDDLHAGVPAQLLSRRPDIRAAELALAAAKLDVKVAKANFYPSVSIRAAIGFNAFNPGFLINPKSIIYSLAGEMIAPLINRNAIKAAYSTANAKQIQAVYDYEQRILNAYVEVLNQLSKSEKFSNSYQTKSKEVNILMESIGISNSLFRSARADYIEILTTQREALESKMELIEIKMKQLNAKVDVYRAVGGGWK